MNILLVLYCGHGADRLDKRFRSQIMHLHIEGSLYYQSAPLPLFSKQNIAHLQPINNQTTCYEDYNL